MHPGDEVAQDNVPQCIDEYEVMRNMSGCLAYLPTAVKRRILTYLMSQHVIDQDEPPPSSLNIGK